MMDVEAVQSQVERALAYAHAALDDPTDHRVAQAKTHAAEILPRLASMRRPPALALGEACRLFEHLHRLRSVLRALDHRLAHGLGPPPRC